MQVEITPAEFAAAAQRDWPLQAEITMLRLANRKLADQLAAGKEVAGDDDAGAGR